jgi:hypothetical protein
LKRRWLVILAGLVLVHLGVPACWAAEIAIQNTQPLAFGSFVAGGGGSVTVTTSGARSAGGGVVLIPSSEGAAATFAVTGDADATYTIQLPSDGSVELTGPGSAMVIDGFTSTPSGVNGQLNAAGSQSLSVGGTLNVSGSQTPGEYTGSFTVITEYQ